MKIRINRLIVPSLLVLFAISLLGAGKKSNENEKELLENLDLFADVVTTIDEEHYLDVEPGDLMMGAVSGMLASLDRYSYIKEGGEVGSAGVGIEFAVVDNILTVVCAVEGGPAARAGIIHGDKIVKINGDQVISVTLDNVRRMVRGEPGTEIKLTLYREGTKGMKDIVLQLQDVMSPGLVESVPLDGEVGYIRLASLSPGSGREFIDGVKGLMKEGMKGLVLDLRDNPGGDIDEAMVIAGHLIGGGERIALIESRLEGERKEFMAPESQRPAVSLAVLVNGGTSKEAEVIAGALKESGRAVIIGSRTFGDGTVQRDIPLDGALSLHLTTGKYIVSGETSFDGEGIEPDVEVRVKLDREALLQEFREGNDVDEKERFPDSQLERAVDLLKGIWILGRGAGE